MRTKIVLAWLVAVLLIVSWTSHSAVSDIQSQTDLQMIEPTSVDKSVMAWDVSNGLSMTWNRTYSDSVNTHYAVDAVLDSRGCVVAGTIWWSGPSADFLLTCISFSSGSLWSYTYGDVGIDSCTDMLDIDTHGFLMVGSRAGFDTAGYDIKVVCVNNNGGLQWNKTYGSSLDDSAYGVVRCDNGDFLICGDLLRTGPISDDALILRISNDGTYLWNETYGGDGDDSFWDIVKCTSGGYVMAGTTSSFGEGQPDMWLVKIDEDGTLLWNKTYGGAGMDQGRALVECSNGDFAITGTQFVGGDSSTDLWVVRTDSSGNMLWNKTFGSSSWDYGNAIYENEEQQLVACGLTTTPSGDTDLLLVMVDSAGESSWSHSYGRSQNDVGQFVLERPQSYLFGGYSNSYSVNQTAEVWLLQAVPSPFWISEPQDQTCELWSSHSFILNFTTPGQSSLQLWSNDSRVNIYVITMSSLDIWIDTFEGVDSFGVLLTVKDSMGAILTGEFSVLIQDTLPPEFVGYSTSSPGLYKWPIEEIQMSYNTSIITNEWVWIAARDASGVDSWTLSGPGSAHFRLAETWTPSYDEHESAVRVVAVNDTPDSPLPPSGTYELTITATDLYDNSISANFTIVVYTFDRGLRLLFPELLFVVGVGIMVLVVFLVYRVVRSRSAG
ncbi:MAG: hypothetical protein KAU48_09825 [Candidatus Thorarchaeota archaeon]|nr:hypothetical protein [Candidatus Thorarchaeota archaeon]